MNRRKRRHRERVRQRHKAEERRRLKAELREDDISDESDPPVPPGPIAAISKEKPPRGLSRKHLQRWKKDRAKRLARAMRIERERQVGEGSSASLAERVPVVSQPVAKWPFFEGSSDDSHSDEEEPGEVEFDDDDSGDEAFGPHLLSRQPPPPPATLASLDDDASLYSQLKILLDQAPPADLPRSRIRKWKKRHRGRISRERGRIARLKRRREAAQQQQQQAEQFDTDPGKFTARAAEPESGWLNSDWGDAHLGAADPENDVTVTPSPSSDRSVGVSDAADFAQRNFEILQRSFGDLQKKLLSAETQMRQGQDAYRRLVEKNVQVTTQLQHATSRSKQLAEEVEVLQKQLREQCEASRLVDIEMMAVQLVSSLPSDSCESASLAQKKIDQIDLLLCQTQTSLSRLMEEASARKKSLIGVRNHLSGRSSSEVEFCVVCWERPRSVLLLPCRHLCLCSEDECGRLDDCPLCRVPIKSRMKIFVS